MMNTRSVFQILDIEPTDDKKVIKKAYANLVKKYHPEEQPEKWKEIHDAYETALKMADRGQRAIPIFSVSDADLLKKTEAQQKDKQQNNRLQNDRLKNEKSSENIRKQSAETEEMELLFDNMEKQTKEQQERDLQTAIETMKRLAGKKKLYIREWTRFFAQKNMLPVFSREEFLRQLGDCFENRQINAELHQLLEEQLRIIRKYVVEKNIALRDGGVSTQLAYAEKSIDNAYRKYQKMKKQRANKWQEPVCLAFAFFITILLYCTHVWNPGQSWKEQQVTKEELQKQMDRMMESYEEIWQKQLEAYASNNIVTAEGLQTGDTREKMISLYGQPDEEQEYEVSPKYDKVIYYREDNVLKIVLESDVVLYVIMDSEGASYE